MSPGVRRLRYHDPDRVHLREDLFVMHVSPSIPPNDFHAWMLKSVLLDGVLRPKQTQVIEFVARRGWHAILAPAVHSLSFLIARDDGPSEVNLELFDGQMLPGEINIKAGPVRVHVNNTLEANTPFLVTFMGGDDDTHPEPIYTIQRFLTGKRVLTSQTFRRLFKAEAFDVGTGMQIKNLTLLFTDLQASTAMYERVGDLNALGIVRRHFEVLESVVASHRGAVVKTIGDAVMAVFHEPDQAMLAAIQMIENVRRAVAHGEDLVLKIGLHSGPCVAIQSNNQIDYFGRTVNIAARVQDLAKGGEIVCSEEVWQAPGVQENARSRSLLARKETVDLKGIGDRFAVRRIVVVANAAARPAKMAQRARKSATKPARKPKQAGRAARSSRARKPVAAPKRRARAS